MQTVLSFKYRTILDKKLLDHLSLQLEGSLLTDDLFKSLYATDASVYRKVPLGVAFPKSVDDLKLLLSFANKNKIGLIPRTAGTSLAGQCVGEGIVIDTSKHLNRILKFDESKQTIWVEPGVVRDELNDYLKPYGLFFGPNTSTSNRCMIGGMVGNNSSGTTSIQYGVTREKINSMQVLLADGSLVKIEDLDKNAFFEKCKLPNLEGAIYRFICDKLSDEDVKNEIVEEFPNPNIHRRNTGYAIDELLKNNIFGNENEPFNLSRLLSGSEGTLALTTAVELKLDRLPPSKAAMVCTHYETLEKCLLDVEPLMQHNLFVCEMMDKVILDCTKNNREQLANRFFVKGDPAAILMLEVRSESEQDLNQQVKALLDKIKSTENSYWSPVLMDADINKALELRKAGLGLLGNMVGDRKAVACIEDTAVALSDLSDFIKEFSEIMKDFGQQAVYYAHAGAGELHLRPILNLKKSEDVALFRKITTRVAHLTKKYNGSFSGEHGDGIVRAEFIPLMIGDKNYQLLKDLKSVFDPNHILNPGKIINPYPMDASLRYVIDREEPEIKTLLDFSDSEGILKAAEKCNGSGDCRKSHTMKGGMCPSYHATKNEKDTTRGRANALREFLTQNESKTNRFNKKELKDVFDLCLSCKACASECPSNVDIATMKAEFLYNYQEANGYSLRSKLFAYNTQLNKIGSTVPGITNAVYHSPIGAMLKKLSGVHPKRPLPEVKRFDFEKLLGNQQLNPKGKEVVLYIDEFTQYLDCEIGADAIVLLCKLGYKPILLQAESGRTFISKGFLKQAKKLAQANLEKFKPFLIKNIPILGIEPSAILTFRDEYKRLLPKSNELDILEKNSKILEEFFQDEINHGRIEKSLFTKQHKEVKIHVHCHQKALGNQKSTFDMLNFPENYKVTLIPSGCCGMAGSFGYEKEHYELSQKIGNLILFPSVSKSNPDTIIAANGTSCRHQIFDGTKRKALHPITILRQALAV